MGLTTIRAEAANPRLLKRRVVLDFLVDSGATYSVIPAARLGELGVTPTGTRVLRLANGQLVERQIGEVRISFQERSATCLVIFGKRGDATLMGVTALENLGLAFDPMRQKIMPMPLLL